MIIIQPNGGRLGNRLHLFIHAMYLHELTGMSLFPEKIEGFIKTYNSINGHYNNNIVLCSSIYNNSNKKAIEYFKNIKLINSGLCVDFMFVKYDLFHEIGNDNIKRYLEIENENDYEQPNQNDLVVHVRLGDYCNIGCVTELNLYLKLIKNINYNNCYIVTDDPSNNFLDEFKKLGCIIRSKSPLEDFIFIKKAKKIIISKSTFSWMSAYISDANEVYFPISDNKWPYFSNPEENDEYHDLRPTDLTNWKMV